MKPAEKIFVKPGVGRKVPLPIPGTGDKVPAEGKSVVKSRAVRRLLIAKDLVEATPTATSTPKKEA